ncbi:hypothetical protein DENIS_1550 [Desulfonema ishimotonii]|uniref:Uncharacterized protein n=1 Tax=Desulfonema ishimotonii TaxID=45657 RepID=A0A401FUF5_9BACT|nr:hypothetical protein [Desulfonema ishimotonii]GBC60593.1 hypothetical protein DENIS_1550 [Desulfonema ishimotonii]
MNQWIPFEKGEYIVVQALLVSPDASAVAFEKAMIEISLDGEGQKHLKGTGMLRPFLMVSLYEEEDDIDLLLDLGGKFKYRLRKPDLRAGKVFAPDTSAVVQFYPSAPWEPVSEAEFGELVNHLNFIEN